MNDFAMRNVRQFLLRSEVKATENDERVQGGIY